ncbi:MAG: penicillin acylase family protein, partial [Bauldia litoralis]
VRAEAPDMKLVGATVPGTPALVIGHNGHIAWGVTTTYIDSDDVFIETLAPGDDTKYLTPDGPKPFKIRKEVIKVRFGEDVTLTVRETRHGPVLPDEAPPPSAQSAVAAAPRQVMALSAPWLSDKDTTADALFGLATAKNWDEFRASLRRYIGPLQNFVYADTDGNIGYYVPGRIPIRKKGIGYMPAPGSTGDYDWSGFIPFEKLPQAFNPPGGVIVNANSKIVGKEYPYFLSREWGDHYRAARITELLAKTDKHTLASTAAIQADVVSLMARELLPLMSAFKPSKDTAQAALARLAKWDGAMTLDRSEPLIFMAWLAELNRRLYADELGQMGQRFVGLRGDVVKNILTEHKDWCDDRTTKVTESCADILGASLDAALAFLSDRHGDDPALWRWGDAHFADFSHPVFRMVPGLNQLTRLRIANSGGPHTVNKAAMNVRDKSAPFADRHGPGYRGIYTFDDLDKSRFTIATGPSGNPYSRFYDNLLVAWRDLRHWTLAPLTPADRKTAVGTLSLVPKRAR